ncbi:ergothioneine biosynthesis protein EgtB [Roseivirga sp.]|uniref:ergothioneine biosynthesis protein EgtB n=1 Tax=Roseivirga sp. TaxID=1964215 RepID=UPI003B8E09FC
MKLTTHSGDAKSKDLLNQYRDVRNLTEEICAPLQPEDFVVQPATEVSPPKWHLAHTTWFFENFILKEHMPGYKIFDDDYHFLFNSYYETEGDRWQRSERGFLTRPWVKEVMAYRDYVDEHMSQFLTGNALSKSVADVLEIGINHEQQHQELLVYDVKHILGINPLFPSYKSFSVNEEEVILDNKFLEVEEGVYPIGYQGDDFHFDNEEGEHKTFVHAYRIQDRLITAGEYMEFIEAGGYEDFNYWLMEGFEWAKAEKIKAPFYWFKEDGVWKHYTLSGLEEVNPNEPITHINYYEADAFAKWKGKRLPTEFEWEIACRKFEPTIPEVSNFLDQRNFRPMPRRGKSNQFFGDVWEWTSSAYAPYPYYKKVDGALGEYNGKFMINQMVLRGGSFATMKNHIRHTYRNFFHPNLRWHFTGLRLAETI